MEAQAKKQSVRVVTGSVAERRSRSVDEMASVLAKELTQAGCEVMRHVVVKGEPEHLKTLLVNMSNDNEADVVLLVGGTGFGPHDNVVPALESMFERRIEGFGESYRRLLRNDLGVHAMLVGATAGVYNRCVAFAMSGSVEEVRLAVEVLIAPVLPHAVDLAFGRAVPARSAVRAPYREGA